MTASIDDALPPADEDGVAVWFAREVPGIVAGLEASDQITLATAAEARRLLAEGDPRRALALALDEAAPTARPDSADD